MLYRVVLTPSEEGFAVNCPALPGCWSQGQDEDDALANITAAIRDYLEVQRELGAVRTATAQQELRPTDVDVIQ